MGSEGKCGGVVDEVREDSEEVGGDVVGSGGEGKGGRWGGGWGGG